MKRKRKKGLVKTIIFAAVALCAVVAVIAYIWRSSLVRQYPLKYEEQVIRYSVEFELDPHIVYSLIKVESAFKWDAVSVKGAVGLMQLMPATAEEMARELGIEDYDQSRLIDPEINIRLGCMYLKQQQERFGDVSCAVAAYNAGPNKVGEWLKSPSYSADGKTLTHIPYKETRLYVEKVLNYYEMYNRIYGRNP
ncbi:MAG TPA: lytic transglycosylase domain-containing protein [Clostridia bacterium]|nr:lytic transglycosylase domain-containing protein [Clostridia bacterium]